MDLTSASPPRLHPARFLRCLGTQFTPTRSFRPDASRHACFSRPPYCPPDCPRGRARLRATHRAHRGHRPAQDSPARRRHRLSRRAVHRVHGEADRGDAGRRPPLRVPHAPVGRARRRQPAAAPDDARPAQRLATRVASAERPHRLRAHGGRHAAGLRPLAHGRRAVSADRLRARRVAPRLGTRRRPAALQRLGPGAGPAPDAGTRPIMVGRAARAGAVGHRRHRPARHDARPTRLAHARPARHALDGAPRQRARPGRLVRRLPGHDHRPCRQPTADGGRSRRLARAGAQVARRAAPPEQPARLQPARCAGGARPQQRPPLPPLVRARRE